MRWQGRTRSTNVQDRRGVRMSGGMMGGGAGLIITIILALVFGINPGEVINQAPVAQEQAEPLTPADEEARAFVEVVLADTEATWNQEFSERGTDYPEPTLVLFSGAVQSACGMAGAAVGPFYCPMDRQVYLDLSFFSELAERFGAPGDFAQAYVIAHEVGHHVQTVLGISDRIRQEQQGSSQERQNELQVRMELQADCLAGVWGAHAQQEQGFIESGDIEEGLRAASAIGDDRLQKQSQGYVVPESFTHGSSEQRMTWFRRGLDTGELEACDTSGEI
jgi:predicted metalloprotease